MTRARRIWTVALCVVMLAPAAAVLAGLVPLKQFQVFASSGLRGVSPPPPSPPLTLAAVLDRSYLRSVEERLAGAMGRPRAAMIRLSNGVEYVSGRSPVHSVEIGRDRWLYERVYVDDWCKRPPLANSEQFRSLAAVQAAVRSAGKEFLFVFSPSKAAIYPEKLPARCGNPQGPRAIDAASALVRDLGVEVLDTRPILAAMRRQQPAVLFGRDGTHWNELGAAYAVSGIFDRLRQLRGKGPELVVRSVVTDNKPGDDGDIGDLLNLPVRLSPPSPHPVLETRRDGPLPTLLIVGTSFNWGALAAMSNAAIIDRLTFFFYFNGIARFENGKMTGYDRAVPARNQAFLEAYATADALIVEVNEGNLDLMYIDELLRLVREAAGRKQSGSPPASLQAQ